MNFISVTKRTVQVDSRVSRASAFKRMDRIAWDSRWTPLTGKTWLYRIEAEVVTFPVGLPVYGAFKEILGDGKHRLLSLIELLSLEATLPEKMMSPLIGLSHGIEFYSYDVYGDGSRTGRELFPLDHFEKGIVGPGARYATALLNDVERGTYEAWLDRFIPEERPLLRR